MNGMVVSPPASAANNAINGGASQQLATDINSYRIGVVAEKLANYAQSVSQQKDNGQYFFQLCLSLASELDEIVEDALHLDFGAGNSMLHVQRGIDYGVANNEPPTQASKLPPVLKQVCHRKNEYFLQAAIMVLMISVKNACKLGWFSSKDTEELLILADEVGNYFSTRRDIDNEANGFMPTLSSVISRFYPQYRLGHIIASLEVEPGYGTYLVDFHITRNLPISKDERIRLLVAMKDNVDSSSCIISPQQVNILLNGRPVDRRTNVVMDQGPQPPTIVNQWLKYGTNLLQAVGQFNGHYMIIIAAMSVLPSSDLPEPQDYVQPDSTALSSGSDSEIIEGPSRISLNCPISYKRIRTPVKGYLCKHYRCFDLNNYVEINLKRPSWRCPHCNQSVCFTDLRVDQKMVKVLQEVGESVSEVVFSADGSWKAAVSSNGKDEFHGNNLNQQEGHESSFKSDAPANVCDLTGEDDEMDTTDRCEPVDMKPIIHQNLQGQSAFINSIPPSILRSTNELNQCTSAQASRTSLCHPGTASYNMSSGALTGNFGMTPVLTDAVSPALNRLPDNFQGSNNPTSLVALSQLSASNNLQLQEVFFGRSPIPRNVNRVPSAIQALPVQMPTPSAQQHVRPAVSSVAAASGPSFPFQVPNIVSNAHVANTVSSNIERQRHLQQSPVNPLHVSNISSASLQNRAASQGVGTSTPSHNQWTAQTLSQPPHLMRSSQVPRSHVQQGVSPRGGVSNSPSTVQRVQLMPQQAVQMRQHPTMPFQTQSVRVPLSLPLNSGVVPQAVSRTENLIDLQENQNWRPTGRMRGALTGQAYSAALNQYMAPSQTPSPRPSVQGPPSSTPSSLQQVLLANRMIAHATQGHNRSASDAANATGTAGTQTGGPQT